LAPNGKHAIARLARKHLNRSVNNLVSVSKEATTKTTIGPLAHARAPRNFHIDLTNVKNMLIILYKPSAII